MLLRFVSFIKMDKVRLYFSYACKKNYIEKCTVQL